MAKKKCAKCGTKLGFLDVVEKLESGEEVCSNCYKEQRIKAIREEQEAENKLKERYLELRNQGTTEQDASQQLGIPQEKTSLWEEQQRQKKNACPVCNTSVIYVGKVEHKCPTCSAIFKTNKTTAKTGIVIGLYVFAALTMIFGCVFGIVTISVWALETGYRTEIQNPTLFVSGCSIIWFSLVIGMILIALGKIVDNSDIQKYYTIAQAKRNIGSNESKTESILQEKEV